MYAVIMAGGGGTRLWPLSSPERPKPFLPLLGPRSLLQLTVDRLLDGDELRITPADVVVVTDRRYGPVVRSQLPHALVVEEPAGRNTAAAVALAAIAIDRPADDVMVVLPADHRIWDAATFRGVLAGAAEVATQEPDALVTLGIEPTGPESGYGYIVASDDRREVRTASGLTVARFLVDRFVEKPSRDLAQELIDDPRQSSWNGGIFAWRRGAIRAAFERFAPDILSAVAAGVAGDRLEAAYADVRPTSIDYAVMEAASAEGLVRVIQMDVGWSDLGSWSALLEALGLPGIQAGVVKPGDSVEVAPDDLVVERIDGRLVAQAGAHGTMRPTEPIAVVRGARAQRGPIDELLERCSRPEA